MNLLNLLDFHGEKEQTYDGRCKQYYQWYKPVQRKNRQCSEQEQIYDFYALLSYLHVSQLNESIQRKT